MNLLRKQILNMQPGRELDVAVHRKVMTENWVRGMYSDIEYETAPHYSTDISAAWEVVETFESWEMNTMQGEGIWVRLNVDNDNIWGQYEAKTAPEAICKAALLSLIQEDTPNH